MRILIKAILLSTAFVFAFSATPSFATETDSAAKKVTKAHIYKKSDEDSLVRKGAKLNKQKEIVQSEEDSTLKKAAKLKVLDEATKK